MYLLYYLTDGLGFSEDDGRDRVFVLTADLRRHHGASPRSSVGAWSDRLGRRKIFVIWSGVVAGSPR